MEIQDGKGPWASPVTGIVPLGSTLTMVIAINDQAGQLLGHYNIFGFLDEVQSCLKGLGT